MVPGSTEREDQKGSCAADCVANPPRCQPARARCCTCRRVLPTTATMAASRGARGPGDPRLEGGEPWGGVTRRDERRETGGTDEGPATRPATRSCPRSGPRTISPTRGWCWSQLLHT